MSGIGDMMKKWLLLFALASVSAPAVADEALVDQDKGRFSKAYDRIEASVLKVPDELGDIFSFPLDHPETTGWFLLGIGGLVAVDKPVTTYYQDHVEAPLQGYRIEVPKGLEKFTGMKGVDALAVTGIAGSWVLGVLFDDEKSQEAALLATKATLYSIGVSHLILKTAFGRSRPVPNLGTATQDSPPYSTNPYSFGHYHNPQLGSLQGGTAMPSYHFTFYFALARVYQQVYDNYVIPYGVAAALLASNIKYHRHWVSDMVAGALIGTMIGNTVTENDAEDGKSENDIMIMPAVSADGTVGISVAGTF